MMASPPWSSPCEWREINRCIRNWVEERTAGLEKATRLAVAIRHGIEDLDPLMEALCKEACPQCPASCCGIARVWFDFKDLITFHLAGLPIPGGQIHRSPGAACPNLSSAGCRLPRPFRPYICTWYLCPSMKEALGTTDPRRRARVDRLMTDLGGYRRALETAFIEALL